MMQCHKPHAGTLDLTDEAGFALPFTIFLVTIITIMLAAAFTRTTADHLVASNSATEVSALAVAQSGLQAYMQAGDTMTVRPTLADSVRISVTGGYAWLYPELIYQPADTMLGFTYIVRSVGSVIHPSAGPDPQATRTVAQFARWRGADLPGVAAFVALNGIDHEARNHVLVFNGSDVACPVSGPTLGFRSPSGSDDPGIHTDEPSGTPHHLVDGTREDVLAELGIDWAAATTDSILNPDHTTLGNYTNYPTFLIDGPATLNTGGTGLLVVTGDLTLIDGANPTWYGLVLVGGRLIVPNDPDGSSKTVFNGMVVTGLNDPTPGPNVLNQDDDLSVDIYYQSCEVRLALQRFGGFHPVPNTWVDNWATY